MKRNNKERLFEVMGRLDKSFKHKLNEGFEEIQATDAIELPAETGEEPIEKKEPTIEEKYEELKEKVEELYAMIHGEEEKEPESELEPKPEDEKSEEESEPKSEEESEPVVNELEENKNPKVPVVDIAKVNKK